jgi:hypothetical protein
MDKLEKQIGIRQYICDYNKQKYEHYIICPMWNSQKVYITTLQASKAMCPDHENYSSAYTFSPIKYFFGDMPALLLKLIHDVG